MNNFCYWQEDIPIKNSFTFINNMQKICLFRQSEYRLDGKTNIFCPYLNAEQAEECMEYRVSKEYGKISK